MSVFIYQDGQLASSWGSTAPETPSCWKHPGHDSPYLQQTSPWVTNLNFDTSVEVVEVVSELACEGGVALPCSVSWTFLKAPFARRPQRSPWPPCKAHGYGRGGPSHPKNWVYARKRCHNTSPLHNLFFFLAFARHFAHIHLHPQWGAHRTCTGSACLFILLYLLCVAGFYWGNWASHVVKIWVLTALCCGQALKPPPAHSYL